MEICCSPKSPQCISITGKKIKVKSKKKLESSQTIPKLLKLFEKQKSAVSHKQRLAFMAAALGAGKQSLLAQSTVSFK